MGRAPCCTKVGLHRGPWTPREDSLLTKYIHSQGEGHWRSLPKKAGLLRCGKSCRLRWMNYLRPGIKRGNITPDEEDLIIRLHSLLGNRWSLIAGRLPGRTDNEIKNYWNTHLTKRLRRQGTDPKTHRKIPPPDREQQQQNFLQRNKTSAATKTQVHTPKAARVRTAVKDNLNPMFKEDVPWCNLTESFATPSAGAVDLHHDRVRDRDRDHDHDLVHASDLECFSCVPPTVIVDNSLEKLYEEYLQLLNNGSKEEDQVQLESFAESLFI